MEATFLYVNIRKVDQMSFIICLSVQNMNYIRKAGGGLSVCDDLLSLNTP